MPRIGTNTYYYKNGHVNKHYCSLASSWREETKRVIWCLLISIDEQRCQLTQELVQAHEQRYISLLKFLCKQDVGPYTDGASMNEIQMRSRAIYFLLTYKILAEKVEKAPRSNAMVLELASFPFPFSFQQRSI
jgi:hypothetical protein